MKRFLRTAALGLLLLLGVAGQRAEASHALGGDLRYESLGSNQYRVYFRNFRDCSVVAAPTSVTLAARVNGCTTNDPLNRSISLPLIGPGMLGTQHCASNAFCTGGVGAGPSNYEENNYAGTVTLPPGLWTLSVEETARPNLANAPGNVGIRYEATLDNRGGLLNNSPNFGSRPVAYVGWQLNTVLSMGAFDIDGDSLAFSLVTPLQGCGQPITYLSNPAATPGPLAHNPGCQLLPTASVPPHFSATYPLPTRLDTSGTCPSRQVAARPFYFNPANGSMSFSAGAYDSVSTWAMGRNRYVLAVKVEEWRRVGGAYRNIGSTRREMLFTVVHCRGNVNPHFAPAVRVLNVSGPVPLSQEIPVRSGTAVSLALTASDANAGQNLTFSANSLGVPGVRTQQTSPNTYRMEFTPPATLPDGLYSITVKVEDDGCPVKGFEEQTLTFRVHSSPLNSRSRAELVSTAYPNPFTDQVSFTLARPATPTPVDIVNQLGQVVDRLPVPAGAAPEARFVWRPAPGVPAGVYLARFPAGGQTVRLLRLHP
ncbi:hypothetical protein EJV47_14685 [Hymenobacter gummosus]|uniref:T9SS type A sorting domain-containing protein n=1 Tax=Hymenobacter gummosus TaxID=1776032 RepID=A0A3S0JG49_9BACT|nr:hypothetical protein [Hymenobacter gummosus]RTQ48842.1 hypothetical protein EJV47_14685 [Hymenobacter gummosus]